MLAMLTLLAALAAPSLPAPAQEVPPVKSEPGKTDSEVPLPPQLGGTEVKEQHGDWQVVCKPPPPGAKNEICALSQNVTAEDRDNVGLTVYVQLHKTGERMLRVFAPLGILLPRQLTLKIDEQDLGHVPFIRCLAVGCMAFATIDDTLLEKLKTGKTAIFIIYITDEQGIGIPISLAGFNEGLEALKTLGGQSGQ